MSKPRTKIADVLRDQGKPPSPQAPAKSPSLVAATKAENGGGKSSPSTRAGRRSVMFFASPQAFSQLGHLAVETGESKQTLMTQALNELFAVHGKPRIDE